MQRARASRRGRRRDGADGVLELGVAWRACQVVARHLAWCKDARVAQVVQGVLASWVSLHACRVRTCACGLGE